MAETNLGVFGVVKGILGSAAAAFAFGEAVLVAVKPTLTEDGPLLAAAALAAERVGSTGVGVVTACLLFTSALISLGSGFLLAAVVMKLLTRVQDRRSWLAEAAAGASIVVGAVATGTFGGVIPAWVSITAQCIMVLVVYSYSNINEMTTALLIIFTTFYLSVMYGQMGVITGLFTMGLTISFLCALRKVLTERATQRPNANNSGRLLERMLLYSIVVAMLGFPIGLGSGEGGQGGAEAKVVLMLESVLWVGFLSAGLLGAGLGTVAMVGLGPEGAGRVAVAAAVTSSVALRAILPACSILGARGSVGGLLGVATAAGVSLGAVSVAVKAEFRDRNTTLAVLGSVVVGAVLATRGLALTTIILTQTELITVTFVAVGAFILGAPKSPFHTKVNLQGGLLTGPNLIRGIGMETVTAAAAPLGGGALGAAALGTAALGRLGTVGVLATVMLAVGKTLSGMVRKSPPTASEHRE
ncbi:uncharacterized protein [Centroberyx affinis]|uniref:uncharacterized protein n=1 Tax=Centroberyx affinis TaxID=166261 RepID=UPI003A5C7003